jgi:hypothetical protein
MSNDEKVYEHPSYGMVQFSHRQGNPKLFGSALEYHMNYVTLSVKTAKLRRSDTGDLIDGPMGGNIVEVDLSAAQFAELLTTMNIGCGVPCTIRRRDGKGVPTPPDIDTQTESLRSEYKARARQFAVKVLKNTADVKEMLKSKDRLSKADRESIVSVLDRVSTELSTNMPFFLEMYEEATEKIKTAAKAEVEAFAVSAIHSAGLQALASGAKEGFSGPPLELPEKPTVDVDP